MTPNQKMLFTALKEYGLAEVPGKENNKRILEFAKIAGLEWVKDDETSWCGITMGFLAKTNNLPLPKSPATARSWLEWGVEVKGKPEPGDIVIFWRESLTSWKGHVALFVNQIDPGGVYYVLGGNQGDKLCIAPYPVQQVLGVRRAI